MIYMAEYVHRNLKFNECIVSVHELTTLHENESDLEIIEEVQKIIKELEAEIAAQRDSEFDGLASYDYIQFI